MERAVRRAARDPGLPRARGRPLRPAPPLPVRHVGVGRGVRRAVRHVGGAHRHGDASPRGFLLCATGCLSAVNLPDIPGLENFAGEVYHTGALAARGRRLHRQARRRHRHRVLGIQAAPLIADPAAAPDGVPTDAELQRADAATPMDARTTCAHQGASTPSVARRCRLRAGGHPAHQPERSLPRTPRPRNAKRRCAERWAEGGVLFSKTFPDQLTDLAANDVAREFAESKIREIVADPAVAETADPGRPSDRHQAHLHRHRLLRDVQPRPTCTLVNLRREPITAITADRQYDHRRELSLSTPRVRHRFRRDDRCAEPHRHPVGRDGARCATCGPTGPITFLGPDGCRRCRTCSSSADRAARRCWRTWCCTPRSRSTG